MLRGTTDNLNFLTARLHGRRRHMATGTRLDALCQARTMPRFSAEVLSGAETESAAEQQRRLTQELAHEVTGIAAQLASAGAELLRWLLVRFQVENLKVLLRGALAVASLESLRPHLAELPHEFAVDEESLAGAKSAGEFRNSLPRGPLRGGFDGVVAFHREEKRPFFFEGALDKGYFTELLARTEVLPGEDRELVKPLVLQEIDAFHLMLVVRGRFIHRLMAAALLPFHVPGTGIPRSRFAAMLTAPDLRTAASRALGRALNTLPTAPDEGGATAGTLDPAKLEALAWSRFQRLADRAFRQSHMGLAAVVAFVELRRVELANLIRLSEGIRLGVPVERIRARMIPRSMAEVPHV